MIILHNQLNCQRMGHCNGNLAACCLESLKVKISKDSPIFEDSFEACIRMGPQLNRSSRGFKLTPNVRNSKHVPAGRIVGTVCFSIFAAGMLSLMMLLVMKWSKQQKTSVQRAPVQRAPMQRQLRSGRDDEIYMVDVNKFIV